jgi:hypothetical protein
MSIYVDPIYIDPIYVDTRIADDSDEGTVLYDGRACGVIRASTTIERAITL